MNDLLPWKVTISVSLKKINFSKDFRTSTFNNTHLEFRTPEKFWLSTNLALRATTCCDIILSVQFVPCEHPSYDACQAPDVYRRCASLWRCWNQFTAGEVAMTTDEGIPCFGFRSLVTETLDLTVVLREKKILVFFCFWSFLFYSMIWADFFFTKYFLQ